jgi:hypothetical protein
MKKEMITSNFKRDGGLPIGLSKSFKVEKEEGPKAFTFNQRSCFVFDSSISSLSIFSANPSLPY